MTNLTFNSTQLMLDYEQDFTPSVDLNVKYKLYIIVPIIWSLIVFFGIIGNGLIIYIILKRRLYRNSCTNCYIINVAIADLCFTLVCVPVTMTAYVYKEWIFGDFMCHFQNLLMFSSVQAACLTLTAMTVDRYLAVLYPFKSIEYRTTKIALVTNIIIWIASFTLNIPYYLYYNQETLQDTEEVKYCVAKFPSVKIEILLTLYTLMISYVLPLLTIIFCYMRMIIKIYSKSGDQKLVEQSKNFSTNSSTTNSTSGQNFVSVKKLSNGNLKLDTNYKQKDSLDSLVKNQSNHSMNSLEKLRTKIKINDKKTNFYNEDENEPENSRSSPTGGDLKALNEEKLIRNLRKNNPKQQSEIYRFKPSKDSRKNLDLNRSYSAMTPSGTAVSSYAYQKCMRNQTNLATSANTIKKQKFKILLLIATVSITFALTWLPAHVIQIWKVAFNSMFPYSDAMYIIKVISHTLTYSNSLLNPFIYVFIGAKFRSHIHSEFNELYQFFCMRKKKIDTRITSSSNYLSMINKSNQYTNSFTVNKCNNFKQNKNRQEFNTSSLTTRRL